MIIDLTGLSEAMTAKGYNLEALRASHPFALFGSRAARCHREDSDWDVVVLTPPQLSDRGGGLDFLQEDPPCDPHWYQRDLAFHLTGYAIWLSGVPNWDPARLQWDQAISRKTARVREIALSLGRLELQPVYKARWLRVCQQEAGRIMQLRRHLPISPTRMLPAVSLDEFRSLGVDGSFLRCLEAEGLE